MQTILAGDVGGTKTNFALVSPGTGPRRPLEEITLPSPAYASLGALVADFMQQVDVPVRRAVIGVPGAVVDGAARGTNLPWTVREDDLCQSLGLEAVRLVNDLEAIAFAVPFLEKEDLHTLNAGRADQHGALAIIAPGTGLGEAFLTWGGSGYQAHPSEGGHADFAPQSPQGIGLLSDLLERYGHVSCERVCSGRGIPNIYQYLKSRGHAQEPAWLAEELSQVDDPTPVIVGNALDEEKRCPLCVQTLEMFASILGAEAGNLALKVLATGGVYLGGGIPPRILPVLQSPAFTAAFRNKGRLSDILTNIPVHVILNSKAAVLGAGYYGLRLSSRGLW